MKNEEPVTSGAIKKPPFQVADYNGLVAGTGFEPVTFGL
jgi:hypothetical protein